MSPQKKTADGNDNFLYRSLPREAMKRIADAATQVELRSNQILYEAGEVPKAVYFPIAGTLVSLTENFPAFQ